MTERKLATVHALVFTDDDGDFLGEAIPMLLYCPECGARHLDIGDFAERPHHTHACQQCGCTWRPALNNTHGVRFLPGFNNEESP